MKRSVFHPGLTYSRTPVNGACAICHQPSRMTVIDLALDLPIGLCCLEVSFAAAVQLRRAGIDMPDRPLIARNP